MFFLSHKSYILYQVLLDLLLDLTARFKFRYRPKLAHCTQVGLQNLFNLAENSNIWAPI